MAYVPGFASDVFISYAHADDESWIQAFEKNLREELSRKLGAEVTVWQDVQKIRLGQNWQVEIVEGIQRAATLLAIVSPSYQNSDWCAEERKAFIKLFPTLEALENSSRFLKIIKKPWDNDSHLEFLPKIQHVPFYRREQGLAGEVEFLPGSQEFRLSMACVVNAIAQILRTVRRQRERVFIASPSDDCLESWEALREELLCQSYDIQPEGRRDITFSDKFLRREIDGALLSVHLLGRSYDAFSEQQINLAVEMERKLVFWLAAGEPIDEQQRKLLAQVRDGKCASGASLPPGWTLLPDEKSPRKLIQEVLAMLKPQPAAPPPIARRNGNPSVYLLCDPTTREDAAFALGLKELLRDQENMDAFLPQAGLPASSDFVRQHQALLRDCDGVLLYREAAPDQWLLQTVPQVLFAEKLVNRAPMRSKAFLLNDASLFQGYPNVNVISRNPQFQLSDLEAFLAPLRQAGGVHAGS
jgi:TIR domain